MQFGFGMGPDTSWMREELTQFGVEELKTPEDVDKAMKEYKGTMLMAINSVCGCAAGNARPGLGIALENSETKPDQFMSIQFDKLSLVNKSLDNARNRSHSEESTKPFIWSISIIFMTVLSMFIAVPISKISPRKGRYSRVLPGLLIFLTYTGLLLSFKGNEVTEITSMMLTHFIFLVLAVILNFYSLKVYK